MHRKLLILLSLLLVGFLSSKSQTNEEKHIKLIEEYTKQIKKLQQEKFSLQDSLQNLTNINQRLNSIKTEKNQSELRNSSKTELQIKILDKNENINKLTDDIKMLELKKISEKVVNQKKDTVKRLLGITKSQNEEKKFLDSSLKLSELYLEHFKNQYGNDIKENKNNENLNINELCNLIVDSFTNRSGRLYALTFPEPTLSNRVKTQITSTLTGGLCSKATSSLKELEVQSTYIDDCFNLLSQVDVFLNSPYEKKNMQNITTALSKFISENKINPSIKKILINKDQLLKSYCELNQLVNDIYILLANNIMDKSFINNEINQVLPKIKKEEYPYLNNMLEKYRNTSQKPVLFQSCK